MYFVQYIVQNLQHSRLFKDPMPNRHSIYHTPDALCFVEEISVLLPECLPPPSLSRAGSPVFLFTSQISCISNSQNRSLLRCVYFSKLIVISSALFLFGFGN